MREVYSKAHRNLRKQEKSFSRDFIIDLDVSSPLRTIEDLQQAFDNNPTAFENYQNFSPSYRKGYLYWLHQAKREATREKRIAEIIRLCAANIKSRDTR